MDEEDTLSCDIIEAGDDWGWPKFFSHARFKTWAEKKKEDSLDILVTVTLHLSGEKKTEWVTNRS